jgi:hypothetical protein
LKQKGGLTLFQIKAIGAFAMVVDHAAVVFLNSTFWMRAVGRVAFPIFAYALVEGFARTNSRKRYLLRLFVLAVASEWIFDRLFYGGSFWLHQNTVFTLFLGLTAMTVANALSRQMAVLPWTGAFLAAWLLRTDYGAGGIMLIWLLWIGKDTVSGVAWAVIVFAAVGMFDAFAVGLPFSLYILPLFSVGSVLMFAYRSSTEIKNSPVFQWAFYLWYPGHLAALFLVQALLSKTH